MRSSTGLALIFWGALATYAQSASAAESCSDILKVDGYDYTSVRDSTYFRQIILSRIAQSTYEQAKSDKNIAFGISVPDYLDLTGDFSEERFKELQAQISTQLDTDTISQHESEIALATRNPDITKAWQDCMTSRGGLSVWFEPDTGSPLIAKLYIEWRGSSGVATTTIANDLSFDGLPADTLVKDDLKCLKAKTKLDLKVPCIVTVEFKRPSDVTSISVTTAHGATSAYLPRRDRLIEERLPLVFKDRFDDVINSGKKTRTWQLGLAEADVAAGWRLDVGTINAVAKTDFDPKTLASCNASVANKNSLSFVLALTLENNNGSLPLRCSAWPSAERTRWVWK